MTPLLQVPKGAFLTYWIFDIEMRMKKERLDPLVQIPLSVVLSNHAERLLGRQVIKVWCCKVSLQPLYIRCRSILLTVRAEFDSTAL